LLDIQFASESDALRIVVAGISTHSYKRVASKLKLSLSLVAPESTIRRRLSSNARFSEAESERVVRLTHGCGAGGVDGRTAGVAGGLAGQ
jgi:uncharacterized protein (DUF2384 family)